MSFKAPHSFVIIMATLIVAASVRAQDYQEQIYHAYLQGRMDTWKDVMDQMESEFRSTSNMNLLYELAEAQYGYIPFCISVKRKKEAKEVLEMAEKHIDILLKGDRDNPRIYSLTGAFFGFRISLEPMKALVNGRKSVEANKMAVKLGPDEPQAWMEKANIEFYKPAVFGGSKERAVPLYEKAVRLYEASPERTRQNWIYLNCLAGLGIAYEKSGQIQKAGKVYRKLLELEPSFVWIRDDLYPQFLDKHSMN